MSDDVGTQFTSNEFQEECQTCGVHHTLVHPENQEMNRQVEVTCRMLQTIALSPMVHARVSRAYINFELMYTADHILLVLSINDLIKEYGKPTTPYKLVTSTKPSISHYVCYCVNVLYVKLLHMLGKSC